VQRSKNWRYALISDFFTQFIFIKKMGEKGREKKGNHERQCRKE